MCLYSNFKQTQEDKNVICNTVAYVMCWVCVSYKSEESCSIDLLQIYSPMQVYIDVFNQNYYQNVIYFN